MATPSLTDVATPEPSATPELTPLLGPTGTPTDMPDEVTLPPDGMLLSQGDAIAGFLGTFCWIDSCRDAPMSPPKSTLPKITADHTTLGFALEDGTLFYEWWAFYSSQSNGKVTKLGHGGEYFDQDASPAPPALDGIDFPAPPPGDWVVEISVYFASGDASYSWHVVVR